MTIYTAARPSNLSQRPILRTEGHSLFEYFKMSVVLYLVNKADLLSRQLERSPRASTHTSRDMTRPTKPKASLKTKTEERSEQWDMKRKSQGVV